MIIPEKTKSGKSKRTAASSRRFGYNLYDAALSKFLMSYEGQLERIGIHNMNVEELEAVFKRCPNAALELECIGADMSECLRIAGSRAKTVLIHDPAVYEYVNDIPEYTGPWELCLNLHEIDCRMFLRRSGL